MSPAIGIGFGVLGFRPCWCPSPFPSPSILDVFHSLLHVSAIGFQSCFFFTTDVHVSPPIHFLGEFPDLGLAVVTDAVVPEAEQGALGAEISIQTSALA